MIDLILSLNLFYPFNDSLFDGFEIFPSHCLYYIYIYYIPLQADQWATEFDNGKEEEDDEQLHNRWANEFNNNFDPNAEDWVSRTLTIQEQQHTILRILIYIQRNYLDFDLI